MRGGKRDKGEDRGIREILEDLEATGIIEIRGEHVVVKPFFFEWAAYYIGQYMGRCPLKELEKEPEEDIIVEGCVTGALVEIAALREKMGVTERGKVLFKEDYLIRLIKTIAVLVRPLLNTPDGQMLLDIVRVGKKLKRIAEEEMRRG